MADSTIANLASGSPAQLTDVFPIQRASSTLKISVSDIVPLYAQQTAVVTLTAAQILALGDSTSPTELIAAPTAGHALIVDEIIINYHFVGSAFVVDTGNALGFELASSADTGNVGVNMAGFLDQTADYTQTIICQDVPSAGVGSIDLSSSLSGEPYGVYQAGAVSGGGLPL